MKRKGIGGHQRGHDGESVTWLTPPGIVEKLGAFDLDPCCPPVMPWRTASIMCHEDKADGLEIVWKGRVWLNPPYGPRTGVWLEKLARHGNGIAIIFARTETEMFHEHCWGRADAMLFLRGRLHFHRVDGVRAKANAGAPSVLVAFGENNAAALAESGIPGALWVRGHGVKANDAMGVARAN